jgi:hypothetical protein
MKAYLLTAILTFTPPDTIPYIQNGYYEADTLHTIMEYKQQHYKDAKRLKEADKNGKWAMIVGLLIGVFLGFGIGNITK